MEQLCFASCEISEVFNSVEGGIIAVVESGGVVYGSAAKIDDIIAVKTEINILKSYFFGVKVSEIVKLLFDLPAFKICRRHEHKKVPGIFRTSLVGF